MYPYPFLILHVDFLFAFFDAVLPKGRVKKMEKWKIPSLRVPTFHFTELNLAKCYILKLFPYYNWHEGLGF